MRRCFTLLTVLVLCASSGCDDKNKEEVADVIVLSRSSVAFAQKGGTTTVAVATPSDWKVSCPDDWVTLASEEGLLTISAASNTTDNVRNSKITVETAGDKQEIAVHQAFSWETRNSRFRLCASINRKLHTNRQCWENHRIRYNDQFINNSIYSHY